MRSDYDCIVVGGGPGGSWAARAAAEEGMRTLLLEKDREIGIPVRCGEAVGESSLKLVVEPQERWIANVVTGVVLIPPNGKEVVVESKKERGFILDRKIFDFDLAALAAAKGAEIRTKAYVYDVIRANSAVKGVRVKHLGEDLAIRAKIVIGADGVESRVGRLGGLPTALKLRDLESCIQYTLANIHLDPHFAYLYFGGRFAPGGYLWIFPKNENLANVGLGILGQKDRQRSAVQYLNDFIQWRFPDASILYTVLGCVPVAATLKRIVTNGLMLVGDAAHQANPITGGGIVAAMIAGEMAGQVAAEAIQAGDVSQNWLEKYAREWHKKVGKRHDRLYRVKEGILKLTDEDLNRISTLINQLKPEERTLQNIIKKALFRQPSLILDVVKAFMS